MVYNHMVHPDLGVQATMGATQKIAMHLQTACTYDQYVLGAT